MASGPWLARFTKMPWKLILSTYCCFSAETRITEVKVKIIIWSVAALLLRHLAILHGVLIKAVTVSPRAFGIDTIHFLTHV